MMQSLIDCQLAVKIACEFSKKQWSAFEVDSCVLKKWNWIVGIDVGFLTKEMRFIIIDSKTGVIRQVALTRTRPDGLIDR